MAEAAKTRDKPLMLSPKALEKALASSGLRARRLAEAFGQKGARHSDQAGKASHEVGSQDLTRRCSPQAQYIAWQR